MRRVAEVRPRLGWAYFDGNALAAARAALDATSLQGVRDELGLGLLHFGYAERFFPGTSVQLSHLRYALFIPWLYQELIESSPGVAFPRGKLRELERHLGLALIEGLRRRGKSPARSGIIGHTVVETDAPVLLPSQIYWPSLVRWNIVQGELDSAPPARRSVESNWSHYAPPKRTSAQLDDELEATPLFDLPSYKQGAFPEDWLSRSKDGVLFDLHPEEREFFGEKFARLPLRQQGDKQFETLLTRLARQARKGRIAKDLYDKLVLESCEDVDRPALGRARRVGTLVQVARSVYASLVESLMESESIATSSDGRDFLRGLRGNKRVVAAIEELKLDEIGNDIDLSKDSDTLPFLKEVQTWFLGTTSYKTLEVQFRNRERQHKTAKRARLEPENQERRRAKQQPEWKPEPLSYRWSNVSRLLGDLAGKP